MADKPKFLPLLIAAGGLVIGAIFIFFGWRLWSDGRDIRGDGVTVSATVTKNSGRTRIARGHQSRRVRGIFAGSGMRVACRVVMLLVGVNLVCGAHERAALPEIAPGVHGLISLPDSSTKHPAVIVLHGRGGIRPVYRDEARLLADHGYVALVLDYHGDVRSGAATEAERVRRWKAWEDALVAFLRSRPDVEGGRIGIAGFSQGSTLALATEHRLAGVRAVVDHLGLRPARGSLSWLLGCRPPPGFLDEMPPVLILHGSCDPVVPVTNSRKLQDDLAAHGRQVEFQIFPYAFHAFNDAGAGFSNSPRVGPQARMRVLAFLDRHLGNSAAGNRN